jgi:hypothetical protein
MYKPDIIREVTDPRTGISTVEKFRAFPPNSGELKAYCDARVAYVARIREYAKMPLVNFVRLPPQAPREKPPGHRANLIVPRDAAAFQAMVERSKTADPADWCWDPKGIRVPQTWYGSGPSMAPAIRRTMADLAVRTPREADSPVPQAAEGVEV